MNSDHGFLEHIGYKKSTYGEFTVFKDAWSFIIYYNGLYMIDFDVIRFDKNKLSRELFNTRSCGDMDYLLGQFHRYAQVDFYDDYRKYNKLVKRKKRIKSILNER